MAGLIATAEIDIKASPQRVWEALVDPKQIKKYMFGSDVITDWKPGSRIVWKGEYEGKEYEDRGEVLAVEENRQLKVTHFSPLSGRPDEPSNYHTLIYDLKRRDGGTHVTLTQDNNANEDEVKHSTQNWQMMLDGLRDHVEGS